MCVYVNAANRYIALVQPIARLHGSFTCVTAGSSSVACTTMPDSFISGAPALPTRPEGESTSDVSIVVAVSDDELFSN